MSIMFSRLFWTLTVERAVKSFAQALVALLGAGGMDLFHAPWYAMLSTASMAAVLSVLTSVASSRVGAADDPSLVAVKRPVSEAAGRPGAHLAAAF